MYLDGFALLNEPVSEGSLGGTTSRDQEGIEKDIPCDIHGILKIPLDLWDYS